MGKTLLFGKKKPRKTFAEYFAGIGLMRLGLEHEGWTIAFANDIDPQKEEMYRANFPDADEHFKAGDINGLFPSEIPEVTLATASFPCNDLSLAGGRQGLEGKNSSAFWGFIRTLENSRTRLPALVLLENVTGFLSSHGGRDFEDAMLALNDLGYAVDPFILDAAWFVPQSRKRLFVVGMRTKETDSDGLNELLEDTPLRPNALTQFILTHPDISWRIRKLPHPPSRQKQLQDILEKSLPETSELWWSESRAKYLLKQMSPRHREIADAMIGGSKYSYGTVFRRVRNGTSMAELRTDGIAGCLRTPRGGSGRQILFKAGRGNYRVRLLTPRECARLMGADDFVVEVPLNQALFGFGDAVCVPVIRWIAKHYLNAVWNKLDATKTNSSGNKEISPFRKVARA
jgi:DNA (cytosine-5)-methyltransferase 1